jgi:hypothetical protein
MDSVNNKLDIAGCVQKNTGTISTYDSGHSGHSTFIEKMIINNNKNKIKEVENNIYIYKGLSKVAMSTVSKQSDTVSDIPDPRFKSPAFRSAVRTVLQYFGYEAATYKDFKEVEQKFRLRDGRVSLDWVEFAKRLNNPRFEAVVYVLDSFKRRCAKIGVVLFGATRDEALSKLDTKRYEFERWFDFPEKQQKNSSHIPPVAT